MDTREPLKANLLSFWLISEKITLALKTIRIQFKVNILDSYFDQLCT